MQNEPVITANTIVGLVTAVLVLLVAFGLPLTDDMRASIIGVVVIVAPLLAAWWARRKVTPIANPRIETETGRMVALVRADTGKP